MLATNHSAYRENNLNLKSSNNLELFKTILQPHFLFNSLNNLYALSVRGSEKTSDAIVNLSQLLERVVGYSQCDLIPISEEIQLIRDYIELEKTWLGEYSFMMDLRIKGNLDGISIPPLAIYTLVENAFKHGIRKCAQQEAWITINILVKKGRIYCKIRNSCPGESSSVDTALRQSTGIGLAAVKKLLKNHYRNRFILDSKRVDNIWCLDLLIENANDQTEPVRLRVLR